MPTQPLWNLGPAPVDFYSMLSGIGKTIGGGLERIGERQREDEQTRAAGQLMGQYLAAQQAQTPGQQLLNIAGSAAPGAPPSGNARPTFANIEGASPSRKGFDARAVQGLALNDMDYLVQRGLQPHQAAALVGHATQESGLNPAAVGDSGTSGGLFQWHNERLAGLQQWAAANKRDPNDRRTQLDYALVEAQSQEPKAWQALQASRSLEEATAAWMHFERPQGYTPDNPTAGSGWGNRLGAANQYFAAYNGRSGGAPAAAATAPAAGVPAPQASAPVRYAEGDTPEEIERNTQAAEAAMMPQARLPAVAAGRAALSPASDLPAPGAVPAGFTIPPAPASSASGEVAGAPVAAVPPSRPAPAPEPVLSQGLRAAAQAGMPPQQLAIVQAMAMNPRLQQFAAQIIGKYAAPQKDSLQRFTGPNGDEYAFDPATGRTAPIAQFGGKQDIREVGGHLLSIRGEDVRDITPPGVAKAGKFQILHNERTGEIARVDKEDPEGGVTILRPAAALPASVKDMADFRQEVNKLDSVKRYQQAVPSLGSMAKNLTVDSKQADMDFFYGVAKVMDPESVVRDSETGMVRATGNLDDRLKGVLATVTRGGRLGEETKRGLFELARGRIAQYRGQMDNDLKRYQGTAQRLGMPVEDVMPVIDPMPEAPERAQKGGPVKLQGRSGADFDKAYEALSSGAVFVGPDGKRRRKP